MIKSQRLAWKKQEGKRISFIKQGTLCNMKENARINNTIDKNEKYLQEVIGKGAEMNYHHFLIPALGNCAAMIVNINGMYDKKEVESYVITPLIYRLVIPKSFIKKNKKINLLLESGIFISAAKESGDWNELCDAIMSGHTALFLDKSDTALIIYTRNYEHRSVSEPLTETETRGARDGFIENMQANIALVRLRIKDYSLRFESFKIGKRTKTDVQIAYIESLVDQSILDELRIRLNRIDIDRILESANIEEFIEDAPNSIFPQTEHTERPDRAASAILDGRIVILIDNTPFALIVPTVFWKFIQPMGDQYERPFSATFLRIVRFAAMFLAISLSSLYVLLTSFHQEMLPTSFALKIAEGRSGVPFPAPLEAFVMEFSLQVMKEAGLRMPQPIGQIVGIVGTFVIGQAAVAAGIVSPTLVIFIALAAICSFAIPDSSMGVTIRLLSYMLLIMTSFLGLFGYLGGMIIIFSHLLSLRSFGEPYLAPVFPHFKDGLKDVFIRPAAWSMKKRPQFAHAQDEEPQTRKNLKPQPPSGHKKIWSKLVNRRRQK